MSRELPVFAGEAEAGIRCPDLSVEGWSWRCVTDPDRADEARELYVSLGFEVLLQAATREQFPDQCEACAASCATKIIVYTRRPKSQ